MRLSEDTSGPLTGTSTNRWRRVGLVVGAFTCLAIAGMALVDNTPPAQPQVDVDSATTWLLSVQRGFVGRTHALVPSFAPATTDHLNVRMGPNASTIRHGSIMVVNPGRDNTVSLVDTRNLRVTDVQVSPNEHVDEVGSEIFRIDQDAGRVVRYRMDGSAVPPSLDLQGVPLGPWDVSAEALWLTVPRTGSVFRIDSSGQTTTVTGVFPAGENPMLTAVSDGVALLDPHDGSVTTLTSAVPRPRRYATDLVKAMKDIDANQISSFAVAPGGAYAAVIVDGKATSLVVVGLADQRGTESRSIAGSDDKIGIPVLLHDRIYISDADTGSLLVGRVRPAISALSAIRVAQPPRVLEVFTNGSMVWANDPNGPIAVAFYDDTQWTVRKYDDTPSPPSPTKPPDPTPTTPPPVPSPVPTHPVRTTKPPRPVLDHIPTPHPTPTPPAPKNTAKITSIRDGANVSKCQWGSGVADLGPNKTLLLAEIRTSPHDSTYYFHFVSRGKTGKALANWSSRIYFGNAAGQKHDLYILIIDETDAEAFWEQHKASDGSYAYFQQLPTGASTAQRVSVQQTSVTDNC